jgi:hypothetical protein
VRSKKLLKEKEKRRRMDMKVLRKLLKERIEKELGEVGKFIILKRWKYKIFSMGQREISIYQFLNEILKRRKRRSYIYTYSYEIILTLKQPISIEKLEAIEKRFKRELYVEKKIYLTPSLLDDFTIYIEIYYPFDLQLLIEILKELK